MLEIYWWKSPQCPKSKVISLEIIPIWLMLVAAIFMYGTSCHEQKHFLNIYTNVKHTVSVLPCVTTAVNQSQHLLRSYVMELLYRKVYSTESRPNVCSLSFYSNHLCKTSTGFRAGQIMDWIATQWGWVSVVVITLYFSCQFRYIYWGWEIHQRHQIHHYYLTHDEECFHDCKGYQCSYAHL